MSAADFSSWTCLTAIFSATALFFFSFPSDPKAQPAPSISSLNLGRPVVDFTIDENGQIWALVDGERQEQSQAVAASGESDQRLVRLLKFVDGKVKAQDIFLVLFLNLAYSSQRLRGKHLRSSHHSTPKARFPVCHFVAVSCADI